MPEKISINNWTTVTSSNTKFFTEDQIIDAAQRVKNYIEVNKVLPAYVTISGTNVNMQQFLQLSTEVVLNAEGRLCTSLAPKTSTAATNPSENISYNDIYYTDYMNITVNSNVYISVNNQAPDFINVNNSSKLSFSSLVYMYSLMLFSYSENNKSLPDYITVNPWTKVSNVGTVFLNMDQIIDAAQRVKNYITVNNVLPAYVNISGNNVNMPQFLQLLTNTIINIDNDLYTSLILQNINPPLSSKEDIMNGKFDFEEYMGIAYEIKTYINGNNVAPGNISSSSLGDNIGFSSLIYTYSNILTSYMLNNILPKDVLVIPWIAVSNPGKIYNYQSNKIFNTLEDAVDDPETLNGTVIGIGKSLLAENIVINKMISIIPVPGINVTIQASNPNKSVFTINYNGTGTVIADLNIIGSTNNAGIYINNSFFNIIIGNNLKNNLDGIYIYNSTENSILDNNISNNIRNGISVNFNSENNAISGNKIQYNNASGINIVNSTYTTVFSNILFNNVLDGVYLNNASSRINFNAISDNGRYGLYSLGNSTVDAKNNWWGSNNPKISSVYTSDINIVDGTTECDSWILLKIKSQTDRSNRSNNMYNNIITVDLTYNNKGQDTSSGNDYIPDGIPISFTTTGGILNTQLLTRKGKIANILETNSLGTVNVTASLNYQSVSTSTSFLNIDSLGVLNTRTGKYFETIQAAIDDITTLKGDTITLAEGLYAENVVIHKSIILKADNGAKVTVQPKREYTSTINIVESFVSIQGLEIISSEEAAITAYLNSNINITNNIIKGNKYGILLFNSKNNFISNNTIQKNDFGIYLSNTHDTRIHGNIISNNWYGIFITQSNKNLINNNTINDNWIGINIELSNNNNVTNNSFKNSVQGIYLLKSNNTLINLNDINGSVGIVHYGSLNNSILSNIFNCSLLNSSEIDTTGVLMQSNIWNCGPATVATLLKSKGINVTQEELASISQTDGFGTSMYGLIQAAQAKGLILTGMQKPSDELTMGDIVLLDFNGDLHFSLIKSINSTDVVLADSLFGNIAMTRETFDLFYSDYVLSENGTVSVNSKILSNDQLKAIKGTYVYMNPNFWFGTSSKALFGLLTRVPYVGVFVLTASLFTAPAYGPKLTQSLPKTKNTPNKLLRTTTKYSSISKYISRGSTKYYGRTVARVISSLSLKELEYKKNYQTYLSIKASEFAKIAELMKDQNMIEHGRRIAKNADKLRLNGPSVPIPDGYDAEFIINSLRASKDWIKSGYKSVRAGDVISGTVKIVAGSSLIEYISFYISYSLFDGIWENNVWERLRNATNI